MSKRDRTYRQSSHYLKDANANTGQGAFMLAQKEAEIGSSILLERCSLAIQRFADRYGISDDEARILLLDTGVRL